MIRNYLKIALRQLVKQRMYSMVKIGGFALSIAACLLIALYIEDELHFDHHWKNADRIYRITGDYDNNGKRESGADWPAPMARALKQDFPEVEKAGRLMPHPLFYGAGNNQLRPADKQENSFEERFSYFDQELLDMLTIPMVYGDRAKALSEPRTMVISRSKAEKFFPGQNPVGRLMILNNDVSKPYKIGGVMENFPADSHLQYDYLLTMTGYQLWDGEQTTWMASNYPTYVLLKPGADAGLFQSKLKLIISKYYVPVLRQNGNKEAGDMEKKARLFAQPLKNIHLRSYDIDDGIEKGDIRFVWLFGAIAAFILIIACINFINLSTAKSANRAKEVGLRKVVGSYRSALISQFLTESILYSLCSFLLGVLLATVLLPYFNTVAGKQLHIPWMAWWLLPVLLGSAVLVGIVAGIYPSFYLSSFQPIQVLKGQLSRGSKNSILRNGLVVFQFTTSIILIVSTMVIYRQTHYMLTKDAGFDKDQVMLLQGTNTLQNETAPFKAALQQISQVKSVTVSDYLPVAGTKRDGNTFYKEGRTKEDIGVSSQKWRVDADYLVSMGMRITEGRNFSTEMASDSGAVIINQTMARKLGLKQPLGQHIVNGWEKFTVIGVMQDFNFESMKQEVAPLCLVLGGKQSTIIAIKIDGSQTRAAIAAISATWKQFAPHQPIRFTFLDESFANMYADVQRMGRIFTSFALLAIVIACLGLFALSAFMAEQRNKEIGIRKVLGASVSGITAMLSRDFVKLVALAILIGSPLAWWGMHQWLQDFAYQVPISWWMFAVAAFAALFIALITISFQSVRAAMMNPIKSLRTE